MQSRGVATVADAEDICERPPPSPVQASASPHDVSNVFFTYIIKSCYGKLITSCYFFCH